MCDETATRAAVEQLELRLQRRLIGRVHDLRLLLKDRGLILRGKAATYYAKQIAQHEAMNASVLPLLANEIEVG
jgi:hypothetical protein